MQVNLLADENVDFRIIKLLREKKFVVHSVLEDYKSVSDSKIIEIAKNLNSVILTLDKDFGEWVFSHKQYSNGILLLRYNSKEFAQIYESLISLLSNPKIELTGKFIVLSTKKIRIRDIKLL